MHNLAKKSKNSYGKNDPERLFRHLVVEGYLGEDLQVTAHDHTVTYIRIGKKANDLLSGKAKVYLHVSGGKSLKDQVVVEDDDSKNNQITRSCYDELVQLAREISKQFGYRSWDFVIPPSGIDEMCRKLPITPEEMMDITGMSSHRYASYGDQFLKITMNYATIKATMDDDDMAFEDPDAHEEDEDEEDASQYFNKHEPGNLRQAGSKRGQRGKGRGGKKYTWKARGNGKSIRGKTKTEKVPGKPNLGQFKRKTSSASASSSGKRQQGSMPTAGGGGRRPGIVGAPNPRSFLNSMANYF